MLMLWYIVRFRRKKMAHIITEGMLRGQTSASQETLTEARGPESLVSRWIIYPPCSPSTQIMQQIFLKPIFNFYVCQYRKQGDPLGLQPIAPPWIAGIFFTFPRNTVVLCQVIKKWRKFFQTISDSSKYVLLNHTGTVLLLARL
jgi:hypothetical protein